jgi:hypothetical protein
VREITKEHIAIFKEYFLSNDESVKAKIFESLSDADKELLSIVETGFENNISATQIALQLNAHQFENEIKEIQAEYYSILQEFEQELAIAITQTEREALKKKLIAIDASEETVFNSEIKTAITQVEREALKSQLAKVDAPTKVVSFNFNKFAKYAAAAAITGIVALSGYRFFANKNDSNPIASNNQPQKNQALPPLNLPIIQQQEKQLTVIEPENLGFAQHKKQTFKIVTTIVSNFKAFDSIKSQIVELKKMYVEETTGKSGNGASYGPRVNYAKLVKDKLDSLTAFKEVLQNAKAFTYTLNTTKNTVHLFFTKSLSTSSIISLDTKDKNKFYIKIENQYYPLKPTENPLPLIAEKDKKIIEQLNKIIFQNQ